MRDSERPFLLYRHGVPARVSVASFAVRLRDLRLQQNLTQQALSARAGIHATQLGRYERGLQPTLSAVVQLAHALGVDPRELAEPVISAAIASSPTPPLASVGI